MPSVELVIAGKAYADYKSAEVVLSMDQLARTFSFVFSDKFFNSTVAEMPFVEGDTVDIKLHGETILSGFLEVIDPTYSPTSRSITVSGRSKACDLVDCSAISATGSWKNTTLITIAQELLAPYGLTATVEPHALAQAAPAFKRQAIEDEETVFECLKRLASMRGLFLVSDPFGNVFITKASPLVFPYALVYGQNVQRGRRNSDMRDRFSEYIIKSQTAGDDTFFADAVGKGFYKTQDPQVTRHRPKIIVSDGQGTAAELQTRGDWERNTRAGQSRRLSYDHPGFLTGTSKKLFPINQLIHVNDPVVDFVGNLLIASVAYSYAWPGSEMTSLEVAAPEGYDILAPPKPRPKKSGGGLWDL